MILGVACSVIANAASILGAKKLLDLMGPAEGPARFPLLLLVRLLLITAAMMLAGLTGTMGALTWGGIGGVALVLLFLIGPARSLRLPTLPRIGLVFGIVAAVLGARLVAQVWFFSPYNGDVLSYHLPKVAEWIRAAGFTREMGVDTHVSFPAGFELVEAWWCVFFHHDVVIEMAGVEFLLLSFAAVGSMARVLGLEERSAFLAGIAYVLTPGVYFQATSCANDGAIAALVVAIMAIILARAPFGFVLVAVGLGVGVKPTFLYALPGPLLLWVLMRRQEKSGTRTNGLGASLAFVALLIGGYWYLRNYIWFGNPIYPVGTSGLSGPNPIQFGANAGSLLGNLQELLHSRVYDSAAAYGPYVDFSSGWGALPFVCGVPAAIVFCREDLRFRFMAVAMLTSLVCVLALVLRDAWSMRFVLFFPALFAVGVAKLAERSRITLVFASLCLLVQFAGTNLPDELPMNSFRSLVREPWRSRSIAKIAGLWHEEDVVGYFVDARHVAYPLYRPDYSSRVVYLRARSPEEVLRAAKGANLWLVYAVTAKAEATRILQECERRGYLRRMSGNFLTVR